MNEKKRHLVYLDAWSIDHELLSIDELNTPFSFIALTHFPWSISFLRKYLLSNGLRDMERSIAHRFSILHGTFLVNYWITTIQFTNQRFLSFFVSLRSMIIVPIAMHFLSMIKLYSFKTSTFGKERGKERLSSRDFNVWNTLVRNVSRCLKQILCSRAITYIYIYILFLFTFIYIYKQTSTYSSKHRKDRFTSSYKSDLWRRLRRKYRYPITSVSDKSIGEIL